MIKFYIPQSNTKRFKGLFRFFFRQGCELCIFPEGLKWRKPDKSIDGIIYKEAFLKWNFTHRQRLGIIQKDGKRINEWLNEWKERPIVINDRPVSAVELPIK